MDSEYIYKQIVRFHSQPPPEDVKYAKWINYVLALNSISLFAGVLVYGIPVPEKGSHDSFMFGQLMFWPLGIHFLVFLCTGMYYKIMPDRFFRPSYPISSKLVFLGIALTYLIISIAFLWFGFDWFLERHAS
jgi:hypothetical protein